jgi:hypothetical protein
MARVGWREPNFRENSPALFFEISAFLEQFNFEKVDCPAGICLQIPALVFGP